MANDNQMVPTGGRPPMNPGDMEAAIMSGDALQRAHTGFITAVTVQKPRDKQRVKKACVEEAALAGKDFFYAWTIQGERGAALVEGPSVDMAMAAAREWGNCGVLIDVDERADTYYFNATFVDLETGYNLQRTFRQRKSQKIGKKMQQDPQRAEDIVFQIGQSKAIRNVVLNALPKWLIEDMMEAARQNIVERIKKKGLDAAKADTVKFFEGRGVELPRIEKKIGKKIHAWKPEDLALLYGAIETLKNGMESAEDLFPQVLPTFDIDERELGELNTLFDQLGINQAERSMKLGACKGSADCINKLKAELERQIKEHLQKTPQESSGSEELQETEQEVTDEPEMKTADEPVQPSLPATPVAPGNTVGGARGAIIEQIKEAEAALGLKSTTQKAFNAMSMQELKKKLEGLNSTAKEDK